MSHPGFSLLQPRLWMNLTRKPFCIVDDFLRLAWRRQMLELLLCASPNYCSKGLHWFPCQLEVYSWNLGFGGHCWYLFPVLGREVPNSSYKQFRAYAGGEDTEKREGWEVEILQSISSRVQIWCTFFPRGPDCRREGQVSWAGLLRSPLLSSRIAHGGVLFQVNGDFCR